MILNLRVDDETYQHYADEAEATGSQPILVIEDRLKRALVLTPNSRYIILADGTRDRMEQILGGGSLKSAEDLLTRVQRLGHVKFGEHTIEITPGQMEEIIYRAAKMGRSVDDLIKEAYGIFARDFFTLIGQVPAAVAVAPPAATKGK